MTELEQDYELTELNKIVLKEAAESADFLHVQFQTQLRNLVLAYIHAITQSGFRLSFYDNGAIKSVEPRGWSEE